MSYERTPPQFMQNIFIAPHNFNDPEHPEHGQYVNLQMRNDLYNDSLYKISACQFGLFGIGGAEEELQVTGIRGCQGTDPLGGFAGRFGNKKTAEDQVICCEDWTVVRRAGANFAPSSTSKYRVKIYQTKRDLFYPEIHPPTLWKLFKYYLFN